MSDHQPFPGDFLNEAGLNRQFVFDLSRLPADMVEGLEPASSERQLILLGHGGRRLWECVLASGITSEHPIDDYSIRSLERWFAEKLPGHHYRILFPGERAIGLQALGKLAGWHHPSPIMVGVDREWGSWYAYRAVVMADTDFAPSVPEEQRSPCPTCTTQPCVAACPANALKGGEFNLDICSRYRLQPESACAHGCLARQACSVGDQHRYEDAQIMHSYSRSLAVIRQYYT